MIMVKSNRTLVQFVQFCPQSVSEAYTKKPVFSNIMLNTRLLSSGNNLVR